VKDVSSIVFTNEHDSSQSWTSATLPSPITQWKIDVYGHVYGDLTGVHDGGDYWEFVSQSMSCADPQKAGPSVTVTTSTNADFYPSDLPETVAGTVSNIRFLNNDAHGCSGQDDSDDEDYCERMAGVKITVNTDTAKPSTYTVRCSDGDCSLAIGKPY
jgi:hypothetical protein